MKKKIINLILKLFIVMAIIYLLMTFNNGDIEYIYATF
jgi:hypothetical protein